jgi:FtsP/CotA-like multicopper oxidase with cupredoxin domain
VKHLNLIARTAAVCAVIAGPLATVAPVSAAVPGIADLGFPTNSSSTFNLVANEAFSSQPDGGSVYSWGYGCATPKGQAFVPSTITTNSCGSMQIPGPTLVVNEGQVVTVTLTNNLPVAAGNTSILFPGFSVCTGTLTAATTAAPATCTPPTTANGIGGVLTREAIHGGSVTYMFVASKPGTYAYYSGTQGDLQVEMGLYGAVIVLPTQTSILSGCKNTTSPNLGNDYRLSTAAFDHPQTCYDREYLFQLAEMQSSIHDEALVQKQACEAAIAAAAAASPPVTCPAITVHSEPYHPNYFLVNGRSMPDDMDAPFAPMFPYQPYNGNPHFHPNEFVLVREIGQGRIQHPLHIHGNHARVLARDGNMLLATNSAGAPDTGGVNGTARLAGPLLFTFPTVSGQSVDALFTWTGKGLNWDVYGHSKATPGNDPPCIGDAQGFYTTASGAPPKAPNYGEYCPDHEKPIPITPPDPQIVANGLWYGGTPYLGLSQSAANGFPSTPLPPGVAKQNQSAGYAFMWHSHNEREITTNDVFPGGMMMMLVVDPPSASINEAQ